jgi:tetratricopeptide (TPR) repeat protein/energy-coupling factor transporter ATP-binding protein EcfA2
MTDTRDNPFPGLRSFETHESHLFFGRDNQSNDLLSRLRHNRFLAVVGTSGSGKSSLVRAGVLPALYGGFMAGAGSSWRIALFRPGNDPIGRMAVALGKPDVLGVETEDEHFQAVMIETTLRRSSLGLVEVTKLAKMEPHENLLVVVDQFEEIFRIKQKTQNPKYAEDAAAFVKLLLAAANQAELPIFVILTMRSDYLGECAQFRDMPEAINDSLYNIPRMTRDQWRQAITGPVAVGGGSITEGLVQKLLNDVGDNQDQLPILQHALMRTWDYWLTDRKDHEPLDFRHYNAIGGMDKALSLHADEAFGELTDTRSRLTAEKLFKRLTERGPDSREIRVPTELHEICSVVGGIGADEKEVLSVIDVFRREGRSFLMLTSGTGPDEKALVDISHESLIRNWDQLKKWVHEEARSAWIYRRIAEAAILNKKEEAGLWRDPDLRLALDWREQNQPNDEWAKRYDQEFEPDSCQADCYETAMAFLDQSKAAQDKEKRDKKKRKVVILVISLIAVSSVLIATFNAYDAHKEKELAKFRVAQAEAKAATDRKITEANDNRDKAFALIQKSNFDSALGHLDKAFDIFSDLGDRNKQALMLLEKGKVLTLKKDYAQARRFFQQADEINESLNDRELQGNVLECRASLSEQEGRNSEATGLYEEALTNYSSAGAPAGSGRVSERLAVYSEESKNFDKAVQLYQNALSSYTIAGDRLGVARAEKALTRIKPWGYLTDIQSSAIYELRGEKITIGRSITDSAVQNDITFADNFISRKHLEIRADRTAEDLRSRNGTSLNANQLYYGLGTKLQEGDILTLANIKVLQFSVTKPKSPEGIPAGAWAIFIDSASRRVHHLTGTEYSLVNMNGILSPRPGHSEAALIKLRWKNNRAEIFKTRDSWTAVFLYKETDYEYKPIPLPEGEWAEANDLPIRLVKLSSDRKRIEAEGPRFQIVLKVK